VDAVNAVAELRTLELAAYGKDEQSAAQLDGLALQAKDLMTRAVKDLKGQAEKCNQRANDLLPVQLNPNAGVASPVQLYYKKGLEANMQKELKGIISDCKQDCGGSEAVFGDLQIRRGCVWGSRGCGG